MYSSASASTYSEQDRPAESKSLEILFRELLSVSDRIFKCSGRLNNMADRAFGQYLRLARRLGMVLCSKSLQ